MIRRALIMRRGMAVWLAAGVCLSVIALTWFGYRAVREWQDSSIQLVDRRAAEAANLLVTALSRDMQAVQQSVLVSGSWDEHNRDFPYGLRNTAASTFARYPYPESFFVWRQGQTPENMLFFMRSDRPLPWLPSDLEPPRFPVTVLNDGAVAGVIVARMQADIDRGRRFSTFQVPINGVDYQIVARVFYADQFGEEVRGVLGFTVNLPWVRQFYFPELTRQVSRVGETGSRAAMAILDERGHVVAGSAGHNTDNGSTRQRSFPVVFFDPRLVAFDRPTDLPMYEWTATVRAFSDPPIAVGIRGAHRALIIAALAAGSLAFGLVLAARAVRASASLAELRSEFVSTVTHELKAPIATIRAIGDTLVSGRIAGVEAQRDYARLVVQEAKRLTRLVDNLLALSRITDVTEVYSLEPISLDRVVNRVIQGFCQQLTEAGFEVTVDVSPQLPSILGDRSAIELMFDNILNNAIRYSGDTRSIRVAAKQVDLFVVIEISDKGRGIPSDEIQHVTRKFFRGRHVFPSGSGLGLAIVKRILDDHGGQLEIQSALNVGTTVHVTLPIALSEDEQAHPHS